MYKDRVKFWEILLLLIAMSVLFYSGWFLRQELSVQKIRAVETPVTILTDWVSVDDLKAFLEWDDTDTLNLPEGYCWKYALQLRDRAAGLGKNIEVEIIDSEEYSSFSDITNCNIEQGKWHAIGVAIIGTEIWYIEPQADVCWHVLDLHN